PAVFPLVAKESRLVTFAEVHLVPDSMLLNLHGADGVAWEPAARNALHSGHALVELEHHAASPEARVKVPDPVREPLENAQAVHGNAEGVAVTVHDQPAETVAVGMHHTVRLGAGVELQHTRPQIHRAIQQAQKVRL